MADNAAEPGLPIPKVPAVRYCLCQILPEQLAHGLLGSPTTLSFHLSLVFQKGLKKAGYRLSCTTGMEINSGSQVCPSDKGAQTCEPNRPSQALSLVSEEVELSFA